MIKTTDIIWVYWTLKQWFTNSVVMWIAWWELVWVDYVMVDELWWFWYPMARLSNDSSKWLLVELYKVPIDGISWPLDSLEWYSERWEYNLYNRIKVKTESWKEVWIYEYNWQVQNRLEEYYTHNKWENLYYNWK